MKCVGLVLLQIPFRRAPQGARGLKSTESPEDCVQMLHGRAPQGARGLKSGADAVIAEELPVAPRKGRVG